MKGIWRGFWEVPLFGENPAASIFRNPDEPSEFSKNFENPKMEQEFEDQNREKNENRSTLKAQGDTVG